MNKDNVYYSRLYVEIKSCHKSLALINHPQSHDTGGGGNATDSQTERLMNV